MCSRVELIHQWGHVELDPMPSLGFIGRLRVSVYGDTGEVLASGVLNVDTWDVDTHLSWEQGVVQSL